MDDELRFHLEMQEEANRAAGMSPEEARYAARRQFGHMDGVKEAVRDQHVLVWFEQLGNDLQFALRALKRSPGFLVVAVPTLTFGIGLCTTIFSVINPILFRPLPFPEPDRLVFLNETSQLQGMSSMALSYADFLDWRSQNHVLTDAGLFLEDVFTVNYADRPERIPGGFVTSSLFPVLGIHPILGRNFLESDERPDAPAVVLLSHAYWQQHYGSDRGVLGRTITLNHRSHTIVGVMPSGFGIPGSAKIWTPVTIAHPENTRGSHSYAGIGRLKPGVTIEQARADLAAICDGIARKFPTANTGVGPFVVPLRRQLVGNENLPMLSWVLLGAVGFVLAVACANVGNLFLARALGRQKEIAVRAAFGASRWRTIRQLLIESMLVAGTAGALGFVLSLFGVQLFLALVPKDIPTWIQFSADLRVCSFAVGLSLITCMLSGLAPAWRVSQTTVQQGLDEAGRGLTESRRQNRLRALLVVSEVALASLLLCGAGLMLRTVLNLRQVDPGFEAAGLAVFDLDLPLSRYDTPAKCSAFYQTVLGKLGSLEGVNAVAAVSHRPMGGRNYFSIFYVAGRPAPERGQEPTGNLRAVTPGYFAAMGIPLLQGRDFSPDDTPTSPPVIIIDRALARQYFPDTDPVGQYLKWGPESSATKAEIIGVVGDVKHYGLMQNAEANAQPGYYHPHAQAAFNRMTIVARVDSRYWPGLAPGVRRTLRQLDATLPFSPPQAMEEIVRQTVWTQQLLSQLLGIFSVLTLALTAVGIAGMVAYTVAQRTHEIGVRMALGARASDVIRLVMREAMLYVAWGLFLGLVASAGLSRVLASQLSLVSSNDPAILAGTAGLFGLVALLACYFPARRATRVDPLIALRAE